MKATNIKWDVDDDNILDLTTEVTIPKNVEEENIADYLSDEYEFCVESFEIER